MLPLRVAKNPINRNSIYETVKPQAVRSIRSVRQAYENQAQERRDQGRQAQERHGQENRAQERQGQGRPAHGK